MKNTIRKFQGAFVFFLAFAFGATAAASAQSLGWEGETGVFVTPLAYTAASPGNGIGLPVVAYHFLGGGPVLGDVQNVSLTAGSSGGSSSDTRALFTTQATILPSVLCGITVSTLFTPRQQ
jgi:hypothetical protein